MSLRAFLQKLKLENSDVSDVLLETEVCFAEKYCEQVKFKHVEKLTILVLYCSTLYQIPLQYMKQ
jgi:hypothetical protein